MHRLAILLLCLAALPIQGQNVDYHFQVLRTDPVVADALQQRLVKGGAEASAALAKLGELIASKRIEKLDELKVQAPSGQRHKGQARNKTVKFPGSIGEAPEGLSVELEAVVGAGGGVVNLLAVLNYADGKEKLPLQVKALCYMSLASGQTKLVQRWDREKSAFVILATASIAGVTPPAGATSNLALVDATIYGSEAEARAGTNALVRVAYTARSGHRSSGGFILHLAADVNGGREKLPLDAGTNVEIEPLFSLDSNSIITGKFTVSCGELLSGTERTPSDRLPKLSIHKSEGQLTLKSGEVGIFPCKVSTAANRAEAASPRFVAIRVTLMP